MLSPMFERFSEEAEQVVAKAQEAARSLGRKHVGTENLCWEHPAGGTRGRLRPGKSVRPVLQIEKVCGPAADGGQRRVGRPSGATDNALARSRPGSEPKLLSRSVTA